MKLTNIMPNLNRLDAGKVTVFFSYETPIAFQIGSNKIVVHENDWSKTTGKHLTYIDGDKTDQRVSAEVFEQLLNEQLPDELKG